MRPIHFGRILLACAGLTLALPALSGCAIANHFLYVWKGAMVPAEFDGLVDQRVAVVCISANDDFGPDSTTTMLSKEVEELLKANVKKIKLVRHDEVANWIDRNNWQYDYLQIGRGVKADMVVAVDVGRLSLHEGSTLYKGHADVQIAVYDMGQDGAKVYSTILDDFTFPATGAQSVTDMSEAKFRRAFVRELAKNIARAFYEYGIEEDVAIDRANL